MQSKQVCVLTSVRTHVHWEKLNKYAEKGKGEFRLWLPIFVIIAF